MAFQKTFLETNKIVDWVLKHELLYYILISDICIWGTSDQQQQQKIMLFKI